MTRLSDLPKLAVCERLVPVLRTARLRISSGDDVARSDRIEAEVFYVGRLVTSLVVLTLFVPRSFSSARPKGQHNVGVQVPKQLQLSGEWQIYGYKMLCSCESKVWEKWSLLERDGGRRGGLVTSALDSGASGPGSNLGQGNCARHLTLGQLNSHGASLYPSV